MTIRQTLTTVGTAAAIALSPTVALADPPTPTSGSVPRHMTPADQNDIDANKRTGADNKRDIGTNGGKITGLDGRLGTAETDIAALRARRPRDSRVTRLIQDFRKHVSDYVTLSSTVTTIQNDLTTLEGKYNALDSTVTTLRGDLTTLQGTVNRYGGIVDKYIGLFKDLNRESSKDARTLLEKALSGKLDRISQLRSIQRANCTDAIAAYETLASRTRAFAAKYRGVSGEDIQSNLSQFNEDRGLVTGAAKHASAMTGKCTDAGSALEGYIAATAKTMSRNLTRETGIGVTAGIGGSSVNGGSLVSEVGVEYRTSPDGFTFGVGVQVPMLNGGSETPYSETTPVNQTNPNNPGYVNTGERTVSGNVTDTRDLTVLARVGSPAWTPADWVAFRARISLGVGIGEERTDGSYTQDTQLHGPDGSAVGNPHHVTGPVDPTTERTKTFLYGAGVEACLGNQTVEGCAAYDLMHNTRLNTPEHLGTTTLKLHF